MRPAILCKLEKDKLLDAQPGFVDTFNWMVDFINNIRGDGDNGGTGLITVDKTIDDRPVIKGGGSGGGAELVSADDSNVVLTEITSGENKGKTQIGVYYL